ncbi:hypothetical protein T08_5137 [Trichinella sp. T8]|nr:hypothetical protein T08_5137 [Trichinella sp. T8]
MNISYKMYDSTFALYVYPDRSADSLFEWKLARCSSEMSVTGILQSHNRTPKCLSLLKSCTRLFQHDIGKLLLP